MANGNVRLRDLLILLPGISGSVLQKDGKDLWGISGQSIWSLVKSAGGSLRQLTLTQDDSSMEDLGDGIRAPRLIPDATLIPGLVKIDGYSVIAQKIRGRFRVEEGTIHDDKPANFIQFPYDWRRDNRVAARQLQELVARRLPQWRKYSGADDAKVILVAHSMGGLVSRYYLEVLEGWRDCRLLISMGTPYRGSLNALNFLANGYKRLSVDMCQPLRSFTSMYQLLPIYLSLRVGVTYRRIGEIEAIPGIERARAEQALAFHHEIMDTVEQHGREEHYIKGAYRIVPVVGVRQPTNQSAELVSGRLTVSTKVPEGIDSLLEDGDGTVPRLSAIPVELSDEFRQCFFAERHSSLQCNETVLEHVCGIIEQSQVVGLREIRGADVAPGTAAQPAISLGLEDLYFPGEPVTFQARFINMPGNAGPPRGKIEAVGGGATQAIMFQPEADGWSAQVHGLPPGVYRLEVRAPVAGGAAPLPVHDLFEVAAASS
jgi:hypothetical protein